MTLAREVLESPFSVSILTFRDLYCNAILLTIYPTTNLFLSLPISAFTDGFWLYFDGYIICLDSSSTLSSRLVFALSFSVVSGHLSSLASLLIVARARPTFYKMTDFTVRGKR